MFHRLADERSAWRAVWLGALLAACSPPAYAHLPATELVTPASPAVTAAASPTVIASPTSTRTFTPPPAPTRTRTPTATPSPACREAQGLVVHDALDSPALNGALHLRVYLPPCYHSRPRQAYPVLYLLHGLHQDENTWDELGADESADALIASGEVPPLLIVMPREDADRSFGQAVAADLVPYIDSHYRTLADRRHRALGGLSRGGGWAAHVGFQRPDLFGAVGLHSLAIFYEDEIAMTGWIRAIPAELMPRIYLDVGRSDSQTTSASWLDEFLTREGIAHEYHLGPGGHSASYWSAQVPAYLRWYTAEW